jgi:hypothetical protein
MVNYLLRYLIVTRTIASTFFLINHNVLLMVCNEYKEELLCCCYKYLLMASRLLTSTEYKILISTAANSFYISMTAIGKTF